MTCEDPLPTTGDFPATVTEMVADVGPPPYGKTYALAVAAAVPVALVPLG